MKRLLVIIALLILLAPVSAVTITTSYVTPGTTFYWNSTNHTYVTVEMSGAGGSGKGAVMGITPWYGNGGSSGQYRYITMIPITENTLYPVYVGTGGAQSDFGMPSNAGEATTAFGYTATGGAGGTLGSQTPHIGGSATSTGIVDVLGGYGFSSAADGESVVGYAGGSKGNGYGSGGGGSACNSSDGGYGGMGAQGIINIYLMNASEMNTPLYTASPVSVGYGGVVTFTDQSTLGDVVNLTYNWSFGDGTYSDTNGSVSHVYSTYGVFSTNLTLTSDVGTTYNYKKDYITVTNTPITAWYTQKVVPFTIVDAYGADLEGANVTVTYISNSLPNKDPAYLTSAFGISQAVANDMANGSIAMQGYTGSDGSVSFMMFPAIQYGITITNATAGLSHYVEVYPKEPDYVIYCPLTSQARPITASTSLANASLYVSEPNASWITWNLLYSDPSGHTTGLSWNVTCWNNMTVMHTNSWGAVGAGTTVIDNYTFPSVPTGMEYVAVYDAVRDIP